MYNGSDWYSRIIEVREVRLTSCWCLDAYSACLRSLCRIVGSGGYHGSFCGGLRGFRGGLRGSPYGGRGGYGNTAIRILTIIGISSSRSILEWRIGLVEISYQKITPVPVGIHPDGTVMHHEVHRFHKDGQTRGPFLHRVHRALMSLGPWEGRMVAFALGASLLCGIVYY